MDNQLTIILRNLEKQNDILGLARREYLKQEATRKHYEAKLVSVAQGKSHAERLIYAQSSDAWKVLSETIAKLEADSEFQKLKMDILSKEYQGEYLSLKIDSEVMKKR